MPDPALVVSQSGQVTAGLPALVAAAGRDPVETLVTDRPEDGRYYLSPATIERIEDDHLDVDSGSPVLVVDGTLHPGQLVDLRSRLPSAVVRDRRGAVWEHLGETNPVAAARFDLQRSRVARREAAGAQREAATSGPSGTSGRLDARDEETEQLRADLDRSREEARRRVRTSHGGVDGRVVLLGRVQAPTTDLWTGLTGESATAATGRPAQPRTATAAVGPHTLAVTDTPGVPGRGGVPESMTEAVPGLSAALAEATAVLCVGDGRESLCAAVTGRIDAPCRPVEPATADAARDTLDSLLETAVLALGLPYGDDAHALVSELHDEAVVHESVYDDAISLRVEVAATAVDGWRRRVAAVDGKLEPAGPDG